MKNRIRFFGIIAIVAIIGFGLIACGGPTDPGNTDPITAGGTTALETAIGTAEALQTAVETGGIVIADNADEVPIGKQWTTQEEADKLNAAITAADTALATAATQTAINNALTALNAAIAAFNESLNDGEKNSGFTEEQVQNLIGEAEALTEAVDDGDIIISVDGSDVDPSDLWVTQDDVDALQEAIDALKEAADQEDIDQAYLDLQDAIDDFEEAKKPGTKETGGDGDCDCGHGEDCECGYDGNVWESDDDHHWNECECGTELNPAEHDWGNWSETKPTSCIATGSKTRTCTVCGKVDTQEIAIDPVNGHDWNAERETVSTVSETTDGVEAVTCKIDHSHIKDAITEYATGSEGLKYFLIDDNGDEVSSGGTAYAIGNSNNNPYMGYIGDKDVFIPDFHRPDADSPYLPVTRISGTSDWQATPFYASEITSVIIGNNITHIGDSAFRSMSGSDSTTLTSVTIGNSVTSIGNYAFYQCSSLTSVTIPDSVTSIGGGAFIGCTSLTGDLTIPDSVTSIGGAAFYGCTGLTSLTIGSGLTTIENPGFNPSSPVPDFLPFYNCTSLKSVTIHAKNIPDFMFYQQTSLESVTIGSGVETIGESAFNRCSGLTSVTLPDSVTIIGDRAFLRCTGLTSVTIPAGVTSISIGAFGACDSLASVTFERADTDITSNCFDNLASLQTAYSEGGIGTYTRDNSTVPIPDTVEWVKQ